MSRFVFFFTKLLTSGILFSTAVNAELVAKLLVLGILPSISVTLVLKFAYSTKILTSGILFSTAVNAELVAKPLILGILPSTSVILAFESVFLTKLLKSGIIYPHHLFSFLNLRQDFRICFLKQIL